MFIVNKLYKAVSVFGKPGIVCVFGGGMVVFLGNVQMSQQGQEYMELLAFLTEVRVSVRMRCRYKGN